MSSAQTQFEARIQVALDPGGIDPQFAAQLRSRLAAAARQPGVANRTRAPYRPQLSRRAWAAGFVLLALAAAVFAIGPQRVLAQVLGWLGYVPGVGFVDSRVELRVLQEPLVRTRQNLTFTVQDGLIDAEHTWLTLYVEGIQQFQLPNNEDDPGCSLQAKLLLPTGQIFDLTAASGSGGRTWSQLQIQFLALPSEIDEATLKFDCVPGLSDNTAQEDWQFPLVFVPAPEDYKALPVVPLATPQATETASSANLSGIELSAQNFVELENGYLLRGRLSWAESSLHEPEFSLPEFSLLDAQGQPVPVELDEYPNLDPYSGLTYFSWTLRTNTKQISSPAQVVVDELSLRVFAEFDEANSVAVDFGTQPQEGQVWQPQQNLQLGDLTAYVGEVEFEGPRGDGTYVLMLHVNFDPQMISNLNISDANNLSQGLAWSGAGNIASGEIEIGIIYDYLPTGVHHFWVDNYFVRLAGPWAAEITLPPPAGPALQPAAACLTPELWLAASSVALPFSDSRLLVEGPAPDGIYFPSLFLVDPGGDQRVELAPGGWGALSPDGSQVAYTDGAGLHVFSVATRQDHLIFTEGSAYSPAWSPSGEQLAFIEGGDGVWLIDAGGGNQDRLPGAHADMIGLPGWLPDGRHLVVATNVAAGTQIQQVDVQTGATENLFLIDNHKGGFTALSPNGEHIAYSGELFGSFNYGLYVSRLDGSQQQLVAQPGEQVVFSAGVWSPDGQWLLVNPLETAEFEPSPQHPIAVSPATCELIPLSAVSGNAIGWAAAPE